jgi:Uma2 family endonuclease
MAIENPSIIQTHLVYQVNSFRASLSGAYCGGEILVATTALISASDYLKTSYEHDAEFVDGRIEERPVGERDHGLLQRKLLLLLSAPATEPFFLCIPELRVQTSSTRFRVPDLCLLKANAPEEQVVTTPPLLCVEILSPEDKMQRTLTRVRDFLSMGVPEVWVFEPELRIVQRCVSGNMTEHADGSLQVPGTPISISIQDVFSALTKR